MTTKSHSLMIPKMLSMVDGEIVFPTILKLLKQLLAELLIVMDSMFYGFLVLFELLNVLMQKRIG